jgi:hypothetical protein
MGDLMGLDAVRNRPAATIDPGERGAEVVLVVGARTVVGGDA